jgi:hypothetical protein
MKLRLYGLTKGRSLCRYAYPETQNGGVMPVFSSDGVADYRCLLVAARVWQSEMRAPWQFA